MTSDKVNDNLVWITRVLLHFIRFR